MAHPRGTPKPPTSGRKKGTPNKVTQSIQQFFDDNGIFIPEKIIELMPELEPRDRMKAWLEVAQYVYPKRKAIEVTGKDGEPVKITQIKPELAILTDEELKALLISDKI